MSTHSLSPMGRRGCRSRWIRGLRCIAAAGLLIWTAAACEKVPLLAPTGTTIILFATNSVIPINGTTEITATVIEEAGTPVHNGTVVTFITTLGDVNPREARTENGKATVRLSAGTRSGTAQVTAVSGSASSAGTGTDAGAVLEILIGGAGAAQLVLSVSPGTVPSTGGAVELAAVVTDAAANRLPGVPVSFTATAGALASNTIVSDASGTARTTLQTDRPTTVTATVGALQATATIEVGVAPAVSIAATTDPSTVGLPTSFTVSVTPAANTGIRDVLVDFGDGESQSLGALNGTTVMSHVYRAAGSYVVTARATDTKNETVSVSTIITVVAPAPLAVTVVASNAAPVVGDAVTFTATVAPADKPILQYVWTFGTGSTLTTTGPAVSRVFDEAGTRTVSVTVTAVDGTVGFGQVVIAVQPEPTPTPTPAPTRRPRGGG